MKVTNFALIEMMNILQSISEKKLPQKLSYMIAENVEIIENKYNLYESQLKKLFESYDKYIIRDNEGNALLEKIGVPKVKDEVSEEYHEQIAELLNIVVDLNIVSLNPELLDYDDKNGLYDIITIKDIRNLKTFLCNNNDDGESVES